MPKKRIFNSIPTHFKIPQGLSAREIQVAINDYRWRKLYIYDKPEEEVWDESVTFVLTMGLMGLSEEINGINRKK